VFSGDESSTRQHSIRGTPLKKKGQYVAPRVKFGVEKSTAPPRQISFPSVRSGGRVYWLCKIPDHTLDSRDVTRRAKLLTLNMKMNMP